jgi:hypothetical protein
MDEHEQQPMTDDEYEQYLATQPPGAASVLRALWAMSKATELVLAANPNSTPEIVIDWAVVVADMKKLNAFAHSYCSP